MPDINHTYKDGVDTVNKSDFIKATKNSDYDNAVNNKDYSLIPKAVLDAIPNGYVLDVESGAKIENSDTKYPNGMKMELLNLVRHQCITLMAIPSFIT